ncbi:hypothetical protein AG4045_006996, partial [Apium graveolens]
MTYIHLSELRGDDEDWVIRVRIWRMWESVSTKDGSLISVDMILIDEISVTSTITLWGNLGELLDLTSYTQDGGPYVIVVSSVTSKKPKTLNTFINIYRIAFDSLICFTRFLSFATTSGSKIYVNLDVGHVSSIRERFSALSLKVIPIEGATVARIPPEEAMFINRMTVGSSGKCYICCLNMFVVPTFQAGGDLMESHTDDGNVPEGDKTRKRVLSPVIKNATENSGDRLSAINKDAAENRSGPVINDTPGNCSGDP